MILKKKKKIYIYKYVFVTHHSINIDKCRRDTRGVSSTTVYEMLRVQLYIFDTLSEKLRLFYTENVLNLPHEFPIGCLHVKCVISDLR